MGARPSSVRAEGVLLPVLQYEATLWKFTEAPDYNLEDGITAGVNVMLCYLNDLLAKFEKTRRRHHRRVRLCLQ